MKRCSICNQNLPEDRYSRRGNKLRAQCKDCSKSYMKQWRSENKERERQYGATYRESHKEQRREEWNDWYSRNKDSRDAYCRQYKAIHPESAEHRRERIQKERLDQPGLSQARQARYRQKHRSSLRLAGKIYEAANRENIAAKRRQRMATPSGRFKAMVRRERRRAREVNAPGHYTAQEFQAICESYNWKCYLCEIELTKSTVQIEHKTPLSRGGSNWPNNLAPCCQSCNLKKATKTEAEYRETLRGVGSPMQAAQEILQGLMGE